VLGQGAPRKGKKALGHKESKDFVPSAVEVAGLMLAKFNSDAYYGPSAYRPPTSPNDIDGRSVHECAVETIGEFNRTHTSYPLEPKQFRPKRAQAVQSSGGIAEEEAEDTEVDMNCWGMGST
jgi:hypothetical protein